MHTVYAATADQKKIRIACLPPKSMRILRRMAAVLTLFCGDGGLAQADISLNLESLSANGLHLEGLRFALAALDGKQQQLQLTIDKISLPPPFDVLSFFELRCPNFELQAASIDCRDGQAKIISPWLTSPQIHTSFKISQTKSALTLDQVQLAGGSLRLALDYTQGQWRAKLTAQNLRAAEAAQRLPVLNSFAVSGGRLDVQVDAKGRGSTIEDLRTRLNIRQLDAQSGDGKYAAEKLSLNAQLLGRTAANIWQWQNQMQIRNGALYIDPVYIAAGEQALEFEGRGTWLPQTKEWRFDNLVVTHQGLGKVNGHARLQNGILQEAAIALQTETLDKLSAVYLQPFLAAGAWEGLNLSGRLRAQAEVAGQRLTRLDAQFPQLNVIDNAQRFALQNATGNIHWAHDRTTEASSLSWKNLHFYGLPIGPASLTFSAYGNSLHLNKPVELPLFDGALHIGRFAWQGQTGAEPEVHFQGDIERVSLQKLTDTLHWPPLSGQLSGNIPGVHYRNRQLEIDGGLQIRLFDGAVHIEDLRLSGLLEGLPRLSADLEINNLDLQQITQRFAFGGMQGRLSGFVRDLELENWQPVTFYAWLGTPDGDDSKHRISQKAVNSLASIGGGGATDLLSRSLLRVFDNFGYDQLGIGCYLHRGVCQLYGVAPAEQGFYIVKGGGLPRIDVIGYNSRIDWQILLQRLRRVLATDQAIIH